MLLQSLFSVIDLKTWKFSVNQNTGSEASVSFRRSSCIPTIYFLVVATGHPVMVRRTHSSHTVNCT